MVKLFSLVLIALCMVAEGGVQLAWNVDVGRVQSVRLEAYHGETLNLEAHLIQNGAPVQLGTSEAIFLWQTNGMGSAWWQTNALCSAGGTVRRTFTPQMDPGTARVNFFFQVVSGEGSNYRANGSIAFFPSPGANPSSMTLPPVHETLNFSEFNLMNAPWITATGMNEAIQSAVTQATNALVIPPAQDISQLVTREEVSSLVADATNALVIPPAQDLSPYCTIESARAMQAESNTSFSNSIAQIHVPSLDGYATQEWVQMYVYEVKEIVDLSEYPTFQETIDLIRDNIHQTDLANYPTKEEAQSYVDVAIHDLEIPSLAGYATESYVANYHETHTPTVDFSNYPTKSEMSEAISHATNELDISPKVDLSNIPTHLELTNYVMEATNALSRTLYIETLKEAGGSKNVWDEELQVEWKPVMRRGALYYMAVTNVNTDIQGN